MTWISIAEDEPAEGLTVLAYFRETQRLQTAHRIGTYWHNDDGSVVCDPKQYLRPAIMPVAWDYLPRAPK